MEYLQTCTQKFNLDQEKKLFSLQPPSPLNSGMIPLDENFYHSFVALISKAGKLEIGLQIVKSKNTKRKKQKGGGAVTTPPPFRR